MTRPRRLISPAVWLVALAAAPSAIRAADYTWNGSGSTGSWANGNNWVGGSAPAANDSSVGVVHFAGSNYLTGNSQKINALYLNSLQFDSGAGAFVLDRVSDGRAIHFANGSSNAITQNSSSAQTFYSTLPIVLTNNVTYNGAGSGTVTISGVVSGAGALTVNNANSTLVLAGTANTRTGLTNINAGTLQVSADAGLGTAPTSATTSITFGGGTLKLGAAFDLSANRNITLNAGGGTIHTNGYSSTLAGIVSGTGGLTTSGSGTLTLSGTNTYSGGTTASAGTLTVSSAAGLGSTAGTLTVNGGTVNLYTGGDTTTGSLSGTGGTINLASSRTYTVNQTSAGSYAGTLAGSGSVTLGGGSSAALTLSGSNSYTGATTIRGGTLAVSSLALGGLESGIGASTSAASNLVLDGGTLKFTGAAATSDRLFTLGTGGGTLDASGTGALDLSNTGGIAFSGSGARTLTLTGSNTASNTLAAVIADGGGPTALVKSGAGTWVLTGTNTYSGGTTVAAGTLGVSSDASLGASGAAVTICSGATLTTAASVASSRTVTVEGGGSVALGTNLLTVTGTLTNNGTLSGTTVVGSGGIAKGTGTYGSIVVNNGGTLAPGNSLGTLTAEGDVTFDSGSVFSVEVQGSTPGSYDQLLVSSGNVILNGTLTTTFSGFTPTGSEQLLIIKNTGSGTLTGTFSNYADGAVVSNYGGFNWRIYYGSSANLFGGSGGNDVSLVATPVPEPGSILLVCAAAGGLAQAARRRWRRRANRDAHLPIMSA